MSPTHQLWELFAGIGGVAAACESLPGVEVSLAIDISQPARSVYLSNWQTRYRTQSLESLDGPPGPGRSTTWWWLSPPCQPFTRRGVQRDWDDPRCAALRHLVGRLSDFQPLGLALENVPPFGESQARTMLIQTLDQLGYRWSERVICPTELGIPNRRKRYYLIARRNSPVTLPAPPAQPTVSLSEFLDHGSQVASPLGGSTLLVPAAWSEKYPAALDIVTPDAVSSSCFTAAYGKSPVRSGSYLQTDHGVRLFTPAEILRLLGFPRGFVFPPTIPLAQQYKLVGNSVSVPVVRHVLQCLLSAELT